MPGAHIGVTKRVCLRQKEEHGAEWPPIRGAERGVVAATEHPSVRKFERVADAAAKQLEQLAKCEAKP